MGKFNPIAFYNELRRRRVFRLAFHYAVVAGPMIGAADWFFPQIPGWVADANRAMGWVIIAAIANFPIAMVLGWLFDITPEGIRRTPSFSELSHDPDTSLHRLDRWTLGGMAILVVAVIAFSVIQILQLEAPGASVTATQPLELDPMALAVLPLTDRSAGGENAEILAFGVHDTLLTLISRIPSLKVISRTTMEQYKDTRKTLPQIAAELGVANFLEGSVQRSGNQVRITVQLIRAPGDEHLWAETYDRELAATNLFQIQSEIAAAVTGKLAVMLSPEERQAFATAAAAVPTRSTEAYSAYALGRMRLRDRKVDGLAQAVEQFALAIELDPDYAAAYSGLADACDLYRVYSGGHQHDQCPEDLEALVRQALALDDSVGEAWISLGNLIKNSAARRPSVLLEAKAALERGLALSPSHSQGYHWYAMLVANFSLYDDTEDWFRAWKRSDFMKIIERGLAADPLSVPLHTQARFYPGFNPSPEKAMWHARRTVEIAPDSPRGYESVAELYWSTQGRLDEAIRWESKAARLDPKHVSFPLIIGRAYLALGDYDTALDYLARAKQLIAPDNTAEIDDFVVLDEALTRLYAGQEQQALDMLTALQRSDGLRARGTAVAVLAGREIAAGRPDLALARYQTYFADCFDPEITDEEKESCPWELMRVYQATGDTGESEKWQGLFLKPGYELFLQYEYPRLGGGMGITEAEVLALQGQPEAALQVLEQAVSAGWRAFPLSWCTEDWRFYQRHDMSLDSIRDDPRFKAAFATIEADMAEQLKSVREMERSGEIPVPESLADPASQ